MVCRGRFEERETNMIIVTTTTYPTLVPLVPRVCPTHLAFACPPWTLVVASIEWFGVDCKVTTPHWFSWSWHFPQNVESLWRWPLPRKRGAVLVAVVVAAAARSGQTLTLTPRRTPVSSPCARVPWRHPRRVDKHELSRGRWFRADHSDSSSKVSRIPGWNCIWFCGPLRIL